MEIGLLGHTSFDDGVVVSRPLERALLARLALARGAPVSPEQLAVDLWGVEAARPTERLRVVVSRLRGALGRNVDVVQRVAAGYRTPAVPADLLRAEVAAERMHGAARAGDHTAAREHALVALAQWRGPALADIRHVPFVDNVATRLDDWYWELLVARYRAELELGDGAEYLLPMMALADRHPLHEPLHCLLATALYRAGRQADALDRLARLRAALAAELGADPAPATAATELLVLRQDPALATPRPATPTARRSALSAPSTSFVGRAGELATLSRLVGRSGVVTLVGPPGCGKSRLATEVARGVVGRDVVPVALATVGPGGVATAIAAAAPALDGVLLVLDDAEHLVEEVGEAVVELRRESPGLTVLVTSQRPLRIAEEVRHRVGPLVREAAARLFVERAAPTRQAEADAVATVCAAVDGLPLGIELAAGLTRMLTPAQLAVRVPDGLRLLVGGRRGGAGRHASLRATLDRSHELLPAREQLVFRRISVFTDAFDLDDAEQVVAVGSADVAAAVAELADRSLLEVLTENGEQRFRLLGTIRRYALDRLVAAREEAAVRQRYRHGGVAAA